MDEFKKALIDGKKAINRIMYDIEQHKIDDIIMPDWQEIIEALIFLKGYITCLEKVDKW